MKRKERHPFLLLFFISQPTPSASSTSLDKLDKTESTPGSAVIKLEKLPDSTTATPDNNKPVMNGEVPSAVNDATSSAVAAQNEEAAKEARKIAKKIINDTAKLDPNRIPQDTGRSRRKVGSQIMHMLPSSFYLRVVSRLHRGQRAER